MAEHTFVPDHYFTTLGPYEPVLRVDPGDTITTTTADAAGCDERGAEVAGRPNPMTGPFFVNGAEPGDTLAITFDRIMPNRPTGFSAGRIAPGVLDPGYPVTHVGLDERFSWDIDVGSSSVRLSHPTSRLADISLPLEPMLGCFGVAPAGGQAISTATSGPHGGNMDYRGFAPGVTVYLPVAEPGALFFLGDGHAVQGDGEIAGTGVETSMEVRFTMDLMKDRAVGWPRAEDDGYLMTVGNARPLDQAVQHATTEMVRWLESDYGFDSFTVHSLLGQRVEYDLANVFDPAYTMVCKLAKRWVTALSG